MDLLGEHAALWPHPAHVAVHVARRVWMPIKEVPVWEGGHPVRGKTLGKQAM